MVKVLFAQSKAAGILAPGVLSKAIPVKQGDSVCQWQPIIDLLVLLDWQPPAQELWEWGSRPIKSKRKSAIASVAGTE